MHKILRLHSLRRSLTCPEPPLGPERTVSWGLRPSSARRALRDVFPSDRRTLHVLKNREVSELVPDVSDHRADTNSGGFLCIKADGTSALSLVLPPSLNASSLIRDLIGLHPPDVVTPQFHPSGQWNKKICNSNCMYYFILYIGLKNIIYI